MSPVLWTVLQEWRTRIVKGSCNPLFGDQFSCVLQEEKLHHINLRMEVLHYISLILKKYLFRTQTVLLVLNHACSLHVSCHISRAREFKAISTTAMLQYFSLFSLVERKKYENVFICCGVNHLVSVCISGKRL